MANDTIAPAKTRSSRKTAAKRPQPGQSAASATATGRSASVAAGTSVRVRMYRQGLGDCFLISLHRPPDRAFHLMIDCGVLLGTPQAAERLRAVIRDIIVTTEGRVDVLAVTHEHYDHVAGFVLAKELFAAPDAPQAEGTLAVGEVWFGWTEDPNDADAKRLREARKARVEGLSALAGRLNGMGADADTAIGTINALRFFGVGGDGKGVGATAQAMANVASFASRGHVMYRRPGESWESESAPGLRIYILGPPDDDASLKKRDSATEVYHLDAGQLEETVLLAAAGGPEPGEWDPYAPFDPAWSHRLSDLMAGRDPGPTADFLTDYYIGPATKTLETDPSWRRIDAAWLGGAEQLALALDSATNNTSLVLAIELTEPGKVLLFPADAQVGNWLSWQKLSWAQGDKPVSAADLLARTIFYKVGHHGSHNATLKEKGLEQMPKQGLVAFIPVDHTMAVKRGWGEMPLPALVDALRERCGDHMVRTDSDLSANLSDVTAGPSTSEFGPLYYDWVLPL